MSYSRDLWNFLDKQSKDKYCSEFGKITIAQTQKFLPVAAKFVLPDGGSVMEDDEHRGLDLSEPLHFPYDVMALEFKPDKNLPWLYKPFSSSDKLLVTKLVVLIRKDFKGVLLPISDWLNKHDPVHLTTFAYLPKLHEWYPISDVAMPTVDWNGGRGKNGGILFRSIPLPDPGAGPKESMDEFLEMLKEGQDNVGLPVVASFLNMLSCNNVEPRRVKPLKAGRPPLPFDDYWELTIDTPKQSTKKGEIAGCPIIDRRSPREHVRRGHIRRYETGLRIWVNAAVISKGSVGKITKTYKVKKA